MAAFAWGILFFMALLGYAVYRFFFKRIIYIRKSILIFTSKLLKVDELRKQIAEANQEGKQEEKFKLHQESLKVRDEMYAMLEPTLTNFIACVTPVHKNYFMVAQSFKDSVKDMYQDHQEMLDITNISGIYREGVLTALKLKNAGILDLGDDFVWWRPEQAPNYNIGTMALAQWLNKLDDAGKQKYQEALDAVSHVSENDLPLFQPLDPRNGFMHYYVLNNMSLNINSAIKCCLQLISEWTASEQSCDLEQDLTYYARALSELLLKQRQVWWAIGWLDLMPTKEEIEAEKLSSDNKNFKPGFMDREFIA